MKKIKEAELIAKLNEKLNPLLCSVVIITKIQNTEYPNKNWATTISSTKSGSNIPDQSFDIVNAAKDDFSVDWRDEPEQ